MKKTLNIILFLLICNLGFSQFSCVKTITKNGCKLNLFNANLVKVGEIDLSKSAWYFQSATNIKIADNVNVFNFINTCVTSPTWSALPDSLTSWQNQCVTTSATFPTNLDTTQQDTALDKSVTVSNLENYRNVLDSINNKLHSIAFDTSTIDTSLVAQIDYTPYLQKLVSIGYDTSQIDTALDKHIFLDSTLVRIINDTLNVRFVDSTYYTTLDSIKYYLSQDDSIEICFDTITFQTYVTNLPTTICNGDSAVRVQLCNTDSTLNAIVRTKIDTTNAILYRIESKASSDTTHETILQRIEENTKSDCIGSNETYYINGTNTITLLASEVCSYAITVIEDVVSFTENGVTSPFNLPTAYSGSTSFKNGSKLLVNQISFTGVNATSKAIIKVIK
jgi:hypothetical protein